MSFRKVFFSCVWLVMTMSQIGWAKHIYGGDFSMSALGGNRYQITLSLYFDELNANFSDYENSIAVRIFAKNGNRYIASVTLPKTGAVSIVYDNKACAELRQLKTSEVRYTAATTLSSNVYTDPNGYYMIWERCCRNNVISNIINPQSTGMAFTLEFPPIVKNGLPFINSSPDFSLPNGDYICINKPFKFDMSARDADGDNIRYSLVAPVAGFTSSNSPTTSSTTGRWPYPTVQWETGFSANNAIKGNRPLSIDAQTGMLSVTATQPGLFVFAVLIEEYRNGERIGAVRREFQLPVVDCGKNPPPVSAIYRDNKLSLPAKSIEICDGGTVELFVKTDPDWAFQWQRNGDNIPNENSASIKVTQPGDYQVIASFSKTCANDTISQVSKVIKGLAPPVKLSPTDSLRLCNGDSALLSATSSPLYRYEWLKDGNAIDNQINNTLKVNQSGVYQVLSYTKGITCPGRDTVVVASLSLPKASFIAPKTIFCPKDSIVLSTAFNANESLEWYRNGQVIGKNATTFAAKQAGNYKVKVTGANKCVAWSDSSKLQYFNVPTIIFDSVLTICMKDTILSLLASPMGGTFSGKGVTSNTLRLKTMGLGKQKITYEITTKDGCLVTANKQVTVLATPSVRLPVQFALLRGESTSLVPKVDSTNYKYLWEPALYLSDPQEAKPTAMPPLTTNYAVTVTSSNGCQNTAKTRVWVYDGVYAPNAFSPNGDGQNDSWVIRNVEKYPNTEVFVYNRWGTLVFYQKGYKKPWDGTLNGSPLPAGLYSYLIDTHIGSEMNQMRGALTILR